MPQTRLAALRRIMRTEHLDRVLITCPQHVRYLSGFSGSSCWLVIGPREKLLITDFRYQEQAKTQSPGWRIVISKVGLVGAIRELVTGWKSARVGFESSFLTVREHTNLGKPLKEGGAPSDVVWVPTEQLIERLLLIKDDDELGRITRAAEITDALFAEILPLVKPGIAERELAAEIEYRARKLGADRMAFPPIVASGPNAALPHAEPGERRLEHGDMVTFDIGAESQGYASDMTRTIAIGRASDQLRTVYDIVLQAQLRAVSAVKPGMPCVELDRVARSYIEQRGYGEAFGHSLGHGVGVRVHDSPSVSWRSEETLAEGMVITIEPGIYLAGWGGVRIEDLVIVTAGGYRVLCSTPKDLCIVW